MVLLYCLLACQINFFLFFLENQPFTSFVFGYSSSVGFSWDVHIQDQYVRSHSLLCFYMNLHSLPCDLARVYCHSLLFMLFSINIILVKCFLWCWVHLLHFTISSSIQFLKHASLLCSFHESLEALTHNFLPCYCFVFVFSLRVHTNY